MSREDSLVTTAWAEENLSTPGLVFVEVDEDTAAYDTGHIPGAVKINWKTELQDPVRRDFVDRVGFEKLLSAKGISNDDTVVLYGGRKKWELDGRALVTEVPDRVETVYSAKEQDLSIRALRDEVVAAIGVQNLVDVRSPDEFSGKLFAPAHLPQEAAQRAGHIPTALNVPWSKAANEDGTFRSDAELTDLYASVGLEDEKDTIAYCRIGERSSHTWFVLTEILGKRNVKNYDGSWTEYGSMVGVPIGIGA